MSKPAYIYKIVPSGSPPPSPLPVALPISSLDQKDNFIHASTSSQLLSTLALFFSSDKDVFILRIPYERIESVCKWEDGKGDVGEIGAKGYFPHLYNGLRVGREEVDEVGKWTREEGGWSSGGWPFGDVDTPRA